MFRRPFKSPLLLVRPLETDTSVDDRIGSDLEQPPTKKLRTSGSSGDGRAVPITEKISQRKPFKAPALLKRPLQQSSSTSTSSAFVSETHTKTLNNKSSKEPGRKPLQAISNEHSHSPKSQTSLGPRILANQKSQDIYERELSRSVKHGENPRESSDLDTTVDSYYTVLWRKPSNKKHKTWDGDGVLSVVKGYANLQDVSGRDLGRSSCKLTGPLLPESKLSVGGKEVEIDAVISKADFMAGKPFLGKYLPGRSEQQEEKDRQPKVAKTDDMNNVGTKKNREKPGLVVDKSKNETNHTKSVKPSIQVGIRHPAAAMNKVSTTAFKSPFLQSQQSEVQNQQTYNSGSLLGQGRTYTPRHDPLAPGALVMPRPASGSIPKGKHVVDVVVDPLLAKHLRPHQREGVQFLYECILGMKGDEGRGAILADEMGLGKTLQTIALVWTLLKQNPLHDEREAQVSPVAKKILIVCPVTLITNWRKEFRKWLGLDRIGVFVADEKHTRLTDFTMGKAYSVMIIGYEKLRSIQDELKKGQPIDLIVADEGHRLKTAQNKALLAIKSFDTDRRILLTGTLMQNTLKEMYETVDLVNPGVLGKYNTFKREFETPILRSRQPEATSKELEKGEARNEELLSLTGQFILRRTAEVIAKFLPLKTESVLFCKPTGVQADMYKSVLKSPIYGAALGSSDASLQMINVLKKLCNGPSLLTIPTDGKEDGKQNDMIASLVGSLPIEHQSRHGPSSSTKLQFLDTLLHKLRVNTEEKIVIVSNYTTTLDMIQRLVTSLSYPFLRLDGKTPPSKRQSLVDQFNNSSIKKSFCFLLSTKAGGTGLNLVGASRLVLFDVDWNPAHDLQAMARIHRDGQKYHCFIYRLVVAGTLEEKIYQRQVTKTGLSDAVVDAKKNLQAFSSEELRKLFMFEEGEYCATHELLNCGCDGCGNENVISNNLGPGEDVEMLHLEQDEEQEDENEDLPPLGVLISAAKLNMPKQEEHIQKILQKTSSRRRKSKDQTLALMQYLHIDVAKLRSGNENLESLVEDQVLLNSLKDQNNMVSYVFSKTTG